MAKYNALTGSGSASTSDLLVVAAVAVAVVWGVSNIGKDVVDNPLTQAVGADLRAPADALNWIEGQVTRGIDYLGSYL